MDTKEIMKHREELDIKSPSIGYGRKVEDPSLYLDKSSRARIETEYEARQKQRKTHNMIRQNICPICSGKLTRGKRNKNKDYKRDWTCVQCSSVYTI